MGRKPSIGKTERLAALCELLGLEACPVDIRYQLLHRTAAAIIEAEKFDAKHVGMIVHSFSPTRRWFSEFSQFAILLGAGTAIQPDEPVIIERAPDAPSCWAGLQARRISEALICEQQFAIPGPISTSYRPY